MRKPLTTVLVRKDGMVRVGAGLLGKLAGRRDLRFRVSINGRAQLILRPVTKVPGWPVIYFRSESKSPYVSLVHFLKLFNLPKDHFRPGEFFPRVRNGAIVLDW